MSIESLNSAAAAAGFAMVSGEGLDGGETQSVTLSSERFEEIAVSPPASRALALMGSSAMVASGTTYWLSERVTGLLGSWRSKS